MIDKEQLKHNNHRKGQAYCKCGHSVCITKSQKKIICTWCGRTIYREKRDEFKEKLGRMI